MMSKLFFYKAFCLALIFCSGIYTQVNAQCPTFGAVVTRTHTDISCYGANDGSITVELGDGDAPLNFELWDLVIGTFVTLEVTEINDPDGNGNFRKVRYENLYPSSYAVRVLKAGGCTPFMITEGAGGFVINEPSTLQVSVDAIDPDCNPAQGGANGDGQIDLTITGGTAPYTVTWTSTATSISQSIYNTNPANISVGGLDGGSYTADIVDANGCSISQVVNVPISTEPLAGDDQLLCNVTSTSLQANSAGAGEIGTWTLVSGTGTIANPNAPNTTVSDLTPGASSTFRWTISDAGGLCPGNSDEVTITVDAAPTAAVAGPDQVLCNTTTTLAANTPVVGTGSWSIISGTGGTIDAPASPTSSFTGTAGQTYQLRWTISNASCAPSSDDVQIIFESNPTPAAAGDDQVVCATTTALAANTPSSGSGEWSIISGVGGTIANPSSPTSNFSGAVGTTYQLRWTITNGSCPPSSDEVEIRFDQLPTTANAGPDRSICGVSHVLEANAPTVGTGAWSIVSGNGGSFADPAVHNTTFTGVQGTTYVLRWTITNGSCPASLDDVQIRLDAPATTADAGPDQVICATNTTLAANTPAVGTGSWSIVSGTGGVLTNANSPASGFSGTAGTTYTLRWTVTSGACAPSSDEVTITLEGIPTTAIAGPDQTICGISAVLAGNTPAVGTALWTIENGTGGSIVDASNPASGFNGVAGNTYTLRWTISNGTCTDSFDEVQITMDEAPTVAAAGADQTLCNTSTVLNANTPTVGTGTWTITSGTGGTVADPSNPGSAFSGVAGTTYTLRWTISNGACAPSSDEVTITLEATPTMAIAGDDQDVCGTSTTLAGNAPVSGNGMWTIENGAGGTLANPTSPTSGFDGIAGNTYTLRWTISNGSCTPSFDDVVISFDQAPTVATAGPDQNLCNTSTALVGNAPVSGSGIWTIESGTGGIVADPGNPTSNFTGTAGETYVLRWTISNGSCPPSSDQVQIIFDGTPTVANAGSDQVVCGSSVNLSGNAPVVGTGVWTIESGAGGTLASPTDPASEFSGVAGVPYTLRWTISNGSCAPSFDEVEITFNEVPTVANAGQDQSVCGVSTLLTGNTPAVGAGMWTIISGTGGSVATPSDPASQFTGVTGTTYEVRWTITNGICPATNDNVMITFELPPTTAAAGSDQEICGPTTTLAANVPVSGTGAWTIESGTGGVIADASSPTSDFSGTPGQTYSLRWTITTPCGNSTDDVDITFFEEPTVAAAGPDKTICGTEVLEGNAPVTGTGIWSVVSGSGGFFADENDPTSTFSGMAGSVYILRWTISNGTCVDSSDEVEITIDSNSPTVADAGPDQEVCGNITNLAGNTALVGTGTWSVISGAGGTIVDINDPWSEFTGIPGTTYELRWTIANGVGACSPSFDDVVIELQDAPSLSLAGSDQSLCATSAILDANTPVSGTGLWTILSGTGGVVTDVNNPVSAFTGTSGMTYILEWSISNSCGVSTDEVTITFENNPTVADAGPDKTVCGTTALEANSPAPGTGVWTIENGAGGVISDPADSFSAFVGLAGTTYTLRWTISNGTCTPTFDEVEITFDPNTPTPAIAGADQDVCGLSTALAGNVPTTGTGTWTIINGTGGNIDDATSATSNFTGNPGVTYELQWEITSGCGSSADIVIVTLNEAATTADAGADKTVCGPTALEGNVAAVGTGLWSIEAGTGGVIADPSDPVSSFTGIAGTVYTLRWTISSGGCAPSFDEVLITIDENSPSLADAGPDQNVCDVTTLLSANTPVIGTGAWTIVSGTGGTIADVTDPVSAFDGVSGITYVLRWAITSGATGCAETSDEVTVTFDEAPTLASAGPDQQVCGTDVALAANPPASGTGIWSVVSGAGGSFADPADPATTFTGATGNTYILAWTISNACGNSSEEVQVVLDAAPTAPVAGADRTVCGPTSLEGNTPVTGTGVWTIETGTGGVLADAANPTSGFSGVAGTTYTLRWTISNGTCASASDEVEITFDINTPTTADAGADQATCGTTTTLVGNTPAVGTGTWSIASGAGGTIIDETNPVSDFEGIAGNSYTLRWTITSGSGSCTPSTDDVVIAFDLAPGSADAGADQVVCGTDAALNAAAITSGAGTWTISSGTGGSFADANAATTTFSGTAGETYVLQWTVQNSCGTNTDEVTVQLEAAPTVANAGADQVICAGINATLAADAATVGTGMWTIVSGTGGAVVAPNNPASQFIGMLGSSYTLRWIVANGSCAASTDDVVINFAASPVVTNPVTVCVNNAKPTLTATTAGATGYNWYYYTDSADPSTRTFLSNTATGSYTPGNELDMTVVASTTFEVTAVYGCGESPASAVVINVSNTGGCGVVGGNCATVVITPVPSPATCTLSNGSIVFNIDPATPVVNNEGVIIQIVGISNTNQTISRTTYNDPNFTALPIGQYEYTIVYGDSTCIKTGFVTIDQSGTVGTPIASAIVSPVCAGTATGAVTIDVPGETGNVLEWSIDGLTWTPFISGAQITGIPAGPAPTFERVISVRRDNTDPCNAAVIIQLQDANPPITVGLITSTSVSVCGGSDGSLSVPAISGGSGDKEIRLFRLNSAGSEVVQNWAAVAATPIVFTELASGSYYVEVRDALGCILSTESEPAIISAPGSVQYTVVVQGNADCGINAGKNGVIAIRFDAAESSGRYQVGVSASPVIEPFTYITYIHTGGAVNDILVDTLGRGNYFVWVKPDDEDICPSVQPTGFIDGPYQIDFDIQRVCGDNDGSLSINLVNVQGDPSVPVYNVEVYRVADITDKVDDFTAEKINDVIAITYTPEGGQHNWLTVPEQYVIKVYQLNQLYCQGERPPRTPFHQDTYTVSTELAHVIEKVKASFPEPRSTGGFLLKTISGGLPFTDETGTYYSVSLIDPATSAEIAGPLTVRRNAQGNYQYDFRNLPIGNYIVRVTDAFGCTSTSTVIVPADTRLLIPNIFTPNGDGINDLFEIVNLPLTGAHRLVITNRWGKEIFSSRSYSEGVFWAADGVPEGIYFYKLDVEGDQTYNGWVEITRGSKP